MTVLTAAAVQKYVPQAKRREIRDSRAPGLHLVIQPKPTGSKSWALRFRRPDGRPAKLTLGHVDLSETETADEPTFGGALTLRQARELANRIDRERARGIDVVEAYKAAQGRQRTAVAEQMANSFGAAVVEFFREHKTRKWQARPRRWRDDARVLGLRWPRDCDPAKVEPEVIKGGLAATWVDKPVTEIDGHDIHAQVDGARRKGIPGLKRNNEDVSEARGRKLYAALSVFFGWLHANRRVPINPCDGVYHPGAPPARERVLTDHEIRAFWRGTDRVGAPYGALLKVLLLTGCRLNEVAGMRRSEHGADDVWTVPATRTKNHRPNPLPLPPLALEIINGVPRVEGDLVFTVSGNGQLTGFSRIKTALDSNMGITKEGDAWILHDLRRTCASGMQRLGVSDAVIERALNHVSGVYRGVAGTYQRDPLREDVRDALARWARYVTLITDAETHAAHEKFLANGGGDEGRKKARDYFRAAVAEGGERWDRYLKTIMGDNANILAMRRGRRG